MGSRSRPFVLLTARHAILASFLSSLSFFRPFFLYFSPLFTSPLLPLITRCLYSSFLPSFLSSHCHGVCALSLPPSHSLSFILHIHSFGHHIQHTHCLSLYCTYLPAHPLPVSRFHSFFVFLHFRVLSLFLVYSLFLPLFPPPLSSSPLFSSTKDRFQGHVQILPASIATDSLANSSSHTLSIPLSFFFPPLFLLPLFCPLQPQPPPLPSPTLLSSLLRPLSARSGYDPLHFSTPQPRLCRGTHHALPSLFRHTPHSN